MLREGFEVQCTENRSSQNLSLSSLSLRLLKSHVFYCLTVTTQHLKGKEENQMQSVLHRSLLCSLHSGQKSMMGIIYFICSLHWADVEL